MSSSYYYGIAIDNDSSENHMQLFLWEFFYQFRVENKAETIESSFLKFTAGLQTSAERT